MKNLIRCTLVVAAAASLFSGSPLAQSAQEPPAVQFPAASPAGTVSQRMGLTDVEIVYSRPSVKGRTIFGDLVPFDQVWRTGANAATTISFSTDVTFDGKPVAAGTYGLFTIPGKTEWTIILHKGAEQWGAYNYDEANELLRVKVKPVTLRDPVETLRIGLDELGAGSAMLTIAWEKTAVSVKIASDLVALLVPQIEAVMASDAAKKPYFQAAMFYYDNDLDIPQAAEWMEKALETQPDAVWVVYRYGLVLDKAGDREGALIQAQRALELANKAGGALGEEYKHLSESLIARLK